jgi:hypothetical protein
MYKLLINISMLIALFTVQLHDFVPHEHYDSHKTGFESPPVNHNCEETHSHVLHFEHDYSFLFTKKISDIDLKHFAKIFISLQNYYFDESSLSKFRLFSFETSPDITPIHLYRTLPLRAPPSLRS